jgi:hypothetical protein
MIFLNKYVYYIDNEITLYYQFQYALSFYDTCEQKQASWRTSYNEKYRKIAKNDKQSLQSYTKL